MIDQEKINTRLVAICPESSKIKDSARNIFVEDAILEVSQAFEGIDIKIQERAATYLAAHYCTLNLYQESKTAAENNFGSVDAGTVTSPSTGDIKVNSYKDKRQEFFEKRSSKGQSIISWQGDLDPKYSILAGTSYGQEYLRLLQLYVVSEPFLLGNDPREPLGRRLGPGDRYKKW